MFWRFIKSLPKVALVLGVILVSTGLFAWWYYFRSPQAVLVNLLTHKEDEKKLEQKGQVVEAHIGRVVMLDDDVYDLDTGEAIFRHWLRDGTPLRVFYDAERKKMIAFYGGGFVRYAMSGKEEGRLADRFPMLFSKDLALAYHVKNKDIWRADVDWETWALKNDKQITSINQFNDSFFAKNVVLLTEKTMLVRNGTALLHVNLDNGAVKPTRFDLTHLGSRRSPDGKFVVGLEKGQFFCYDVNEDAVKTIQVGRGAINSYQWLGNDRCAFIASGKEVMVYDRPSHKLTEIAALPDFCNKIGEPSPDGRSVFCGSRKSIILVDIEHKRADTLMGGRGIGWVNSDSFVYSREVPDSDLRGTWMQEPAGKERRIWNEPFIPSKSGKSVLPIKSAALVVFVTKDGVMRMNPDGTEVQVVKNLATASGRFVQLPSRLLGIEDWKGKAQASEQAEDQDQ